MSSEIFKIILNLPFKPLILVWCSPRLSVESYKVRTSQWRDAGKQAREDPGLSFCPLPVR